MTLTNLRVSLKNAAVVLSIAAVFMPITAVKAASLSELQNRLKKAEADLQQFQALQQKEENKAESYASQVNTTQAEINEVRRTIAQLENSIQTKETEIDSTTKEIIKKSEELTQLNDSLDNSLASLYELTNFSQVEMTARGDGISHYADRSEYMQALQDRIIEDIETANKIKADLENTNAQLQQKKNELAALKGDQQEKNADLAQQKQQQTQQLNKSVATAAQYEAKAQQLEAEKRVLSREIYELRQRLSRKNTGERLVISKTAYPFQVGPNVWRVDPWDFYMSECTSYAAWKWYSYYGTAFRSGHDGNSGDAYNWPTLARARGYTTSKTPRKNSVISWARASGMPYGHVAWVEGVNSDGTIDITEYNWVSPHAFSRRENVPYWAWGSATFIYK